ncbi:MULTISPECIES: ATP/GTP-binding protein [unclassified Streptomyces]|uniref:GTP-binding protein n=1 Tax=unclassified Streptomyces TaxID=2593676 RepID=UPI00210CFC35|nr:ATP/GTP-binding protein [Streptomyces sp. LcepLS]
MAYEPAGGAYEPAGGTGERGGGEGTVALDFGRLVLRPDLTVCLFGVPGLERSAALCEDMCAGALGAVVLVDTGRLAESFALVDRLEERALPFVVVVNRFAGPTAYTSEQVASALGLSPGVPVLAGDVRETTTVRHVLAELVAYTGRFRAARLLEAVSR